MLDESIAGDEAEPTLASVEAVSGIALLCLAVPLAILTLMYVWLAVDHRTLLLWHVQIHESGHYTFGETVFYFNHFLREVAIDIAYALFVLAGCAGAGGLKLGEAVDSRRPMVLACVALGAACALIAAAVVGAAGKHGLDSAVRDLLQFRTRDDLSGYGSHWRFHWLSTLWFGVAALLCAPLIARPLDGNLSDPRRQMYIARWLPWVYFATLTTAFGLSSKTFLDVRYAGHQAREILTHGPVTGLFALGALQLSTRWLSGSLRRWPRAAPSIRLTPTTCVQLALFVTIPVYLAVVTSSGAVMEVGQSEYGLVAMIGAHFFEHTLDYVLVVLLTVGGYGWLIARQMPEEAS